MVENKHRLGTRGAFLLADGQRILKLPLNDNVYYVPRAAAVCRLVRTSYIQAVVAQRQSTVHIHTHSRGMLLRHCDIYPSANCIQAAVAQWYTYHTRAACRTCRTCACVVRVVRVVSYVCVSYVCVSYVCVSYVCVLAVYVAVCVCRTCARMSNAMYLLCLLTRNIYCQLLRR